MPKSPPLDVARLRSALAGGRWSDVRWTASTGSTNADVAAWAKSGAAGAGAVLVAEHQDAGRGRLGRGWESPAGASLAMSALVAPQVPAERWTWLPLITGLAVAEGVRAVGVDDVTVKWPNDVLVGGRKICGILVERVEAPGGAAAVVGFGVNVSLDESELPVPTATSLLLLGCAAAKHDVAAAILHALDGWLSRLDSGADLTTAYAVGCATVGRDARVEVVGGDAVLGTAFGVDDSGRLGVRTPSGPRWFAAGDVFHLR